MLGRCVRSRATASSVITKSILTEGMKGTKEDTSVILPNGMTNLLGRRIFYSIDPMSASKLGKFFHISF